jgi:hypothetical protein
VQAVEPLLEAQFGIVAQQNDSSHPFHCRPKWNRPSERDVVRMSSI